MMLVTIEVSDLEIESVMECARVGYWDDHRFPDGVPCPTEAQLSRGLYLMAKQCPRQFGQLVSGRGDGDTGDILLQYSLLGEHIYG